MAVTPKVGRAEIFDPDQAFRSIVKINLRSANFVRGQELGDLDVMPVLFVLEIVFIVDDRLFRRTTNAIEFLVGVALLDRRDPDLLVFKPGKMNSSLPEEQLGPG